MAEEHGTIRFQFADKGERQISPPVDMHTSRISTGALAVPTGEKLRALPNNPQVQIAGARLIMGFISDASDTIESEESDCEIDVLVLDGRNRIVGSETIKLEAMTGFKPSDSVDIVCTANTHQRVAYKDAPEGHKYMLNPQGKTRVFLGDDT